MMTLSSIIARFEAAYLNQYRHAILPGQRQALAAMKHCRTTLAPRMLYALLFECAWDTVRTFSRNDKQLQGTPGAMTVRITGSTGLSMAESPDAR